MSSSTCIKCTAPLESGARFCGGCGAQQPSPPHNPIGNKTLFQAGGGPIRPSRPAQAEAARPSQPVQPLQAPVRAATAAAPSAVAATPAPKKVTAPAPALPEDLTGQTLNDRYLVEDQIGNGGFGTVYRALQLQMSRRVALKVLHPRMAKDPQVVERFRREAQASSLLRQPHTVQVYDFDRLPDGTLYLAMELLEGRSLHEVLGIEGKLAPIRLARIIDGIAESLGEAHGQGIVHRDIKPENIYLEPRPEVDFVKVLDFGIAKIISGDAGSRPQLTAVGQTLGTVEYMSPEQLMGLPLDGRSDLYAVGILTYELLVGRLPFAGAHATDIIAGHLKGVPLAPSQALGAEAAGSPEVWAAWDKIILRLLEKKRENRFANAGELRRALAPLCSADEVASPPGAAAPPRPTVEPANSPALTQKRRAETPSWIPIAAALAAVLVFGLVIFFLRHGR